jgi:hypothetical protein
VVQHDRRPHLNAITVESYGRRHRDRVEHRPVLAREILQPGIVVREENPGVTPGDTADVQIDWLAPFEAAWRQRLV